MWLRSPGFRCAQSGLRWLYFAYWMYFFLPVIFDFIFIILMVFPFWQLSHIKFIISPLSVCICALVIEPANFPISCCVFRAVPVSNTVSSPLNLKVQRQMNRMPMIPKKKSYQPVVHSPSDHCRRFFSSSPRSSLVTRVLQALACCLGLGFGS